MILCPQRRNLHPGRCVLLNVKFENHIEKKHWEHGKGWKHIDSNNSSWMLQTNKYNIVSPYLFWCGRRGGCNKKEGPKGLHVFCLTDCVFWCYSSLFIPKPFSYLARDYWILMNFWWNSRELMFCWTIHKDKSFSQTLCEVACRPIQASPKLYFTLGWPRENAKGLFSQPLEWIFFLK